MVPYYLHVHVYLFNSAIVQSNTILLAFLRYFNFGRIRELRLCPISTLHKLTVFDHKLPKKKIMLAQTNALEYVNIYASVLFLTSTPKPLHIIYTIKK